MVKFQKIARSSTRQQRRVAMNRQTAAHRDAVAPLAVLRWLCRRPEIPTMQPAHHCPPLHRPQRGRFDSPPIRRILVEPQVGARSMVVGVAPLRRTVWI